MPAAEAAWLQLAITAENVSVRRRGSVLDLPAGPGFRVEKEIKNVVVALAKSHHYWDDHLADEQQRDPGRSGGRWVSFSCGGDRSRLARGRRSD